MRQPLLVISLFISFLLCGNLHAFGKEPEPYYPLKEGMTWEYQVMFHTRNELLRAQGADKVDKSDTKKLTVTNLASQEIDGKKVTPRKYDFSAFHFFYYLFQEDNGIFIIATQPPNSEEKKILNPPELLMKIPVLAGVAWEGNFKGGWNSNLNIKLNKVIDRGDEVVTVAGRSFDNCIRIKGEGEAKDTYKDPADKSGKEQKLIISVETNDWYAPGVGWVKEVTRELVKKETGKQELIFSRKIISQLESFKEK
ncbi:MAG: hypothetical protein A2Y80_00580 [Deltaproteobacteria bacterium RBG_13_58_19]|nr:MAG: hypothetical protein A2Y80_00580 [Deltaproteobacteria bacterium RBG_13_58_19]